MASSSTVKRLLLAGLVLFAVTVGAARANDQDRLTPNDLRQAAVKAMVEGYSTAAYAMAQALLRRDPGDPDALFIATRAARNLGNYDEAADLGKTLWAKAETDDHRFAAAMSVAQALSSDGQRTLAQLWLRRASHVAPTDATRAAAIRDFRYVRARNPWAAALSFHVAPNTNINNGSARETSKLFGLPFEFQLSGASQALSGLEYSAGVGGRYRFDQSALHAHDVVFQASYRTFTLSDEARTQAPDVSGSDFAFGQVAVGYRFHATPETGSGPFSLGAMVGQSWYGGDAYRSYVRLDGHKRFVLSNRVTLGFSGFAERQWGDMAGDADRLGANLRLARQMGSVGTLGLSFGTTTGFSDTDVEDFSELRGGIDFALAKPVFGAAVSFGLNLRHRDFDRSRYDPAGRVDTEVSARINIVFRQIDVYGFNPTVTLSASETDSSIGLFDSNRFGVRFGVQSAF